MEKRALRNESSCEPTALAHCVDKARPALWDCLSGLCFAETVLSSGDQPVCATTNRTTHNPWNHFQTI
jgi:hypothetical protein